METTTACNSGDDLMDQDSNAISSANDFGSTTGCTAPKVPACNKKVEEDVNVECNTLTSAMLFEPCNVIINPRPF